MQEPQLQRSLHVTNLSSILTPDQLRQLFAFCGTVTKAKYIDDTKLQAVVEFSKPSEAISALALSGMAVGDKVMKAELCSTVKQRQETSGNVPLAVQQAMQQMQYNQAVYLQQAQAANLAASKIAKSKSAAEMAAQRVKEISKKLSGIGGGETVSVAEVKTEEGKKEVHQKRYKKCNFSFF